MIGSDQAAGLRRAAPPPTASDSGATARLVAISSGKGGVGKTFLTVNLALALRKHRKRVLIVDADLGLANADIALGVSPELTLQDVVFNGRPLEEVVCQGICGVDLVAASSGSREMVMLGESRLATLIDALRRLALSYDVVLLDCASGIAPMVLDIIAASRHNLIVVTPDPASIMDVYALSKVVHQRQLASELNIVINRVRQPSEGRRAFQVLQEATRRFLCADLRLAGMLPHSNGANRALADGQPLLLRNASDPAAQAVQKLAGRLLERHLQAENLSP